MSLNVEPIGLRGLRALALLGALLTLTYGFVDLNRVSGSPLPLGERVLAAGILAGYAVGTWVSPAVRRRAAPIFRWLMGALGVWAASGGLRHGFTINDALATQVTAFVVGVVFPSVLSLVGFYAAMLAMIGAGFVWGPPAEVDPGIVIGTMLTGFLATAFVTRVRSQATAEISELLLLESRVHNAIVLLDRAGRLRRTNESFDALMGGGRTGDRYTDLLAIPPTGPEAAFGLSTALSHGTGGSFEVAHRRTGGEPRWMTAEITPVERDGVVTGFIVVLSDATRSRAVVTRILDAMSDALFIVGGGGRVDKVNPAACRLLDATEEDLVGSPFAARVVPDWRWTDGVEAEEASTPGSGAHLLTLLLGGELDTPAVDLDLALRARTGEVIPVLVAASLLPVAPDEPRRVLIVARDARERRRLEQERAQLERRVQEAQKLEGLGVLAGGIAHDFNNLLVGILGNSSLALTRLPLDHPVRGLLEGIDRSAQRAADLTRQMLAYAGKGQFVVEPLDLSELVEEMTDLIEASLSKRARLSFSLDHHLPMIEGDATQFRQLIMNLLTNASDALGDSDGTLFVRTAVVDPTPPAGDRHGAEVVGRRCVLLEVRDDGRGMTEEVRRRMFDPFFTTKARGRGLGLAATLGIVKAHHGAIAVESAVGEGTTIRVWVPASSRPRPRRNSLPPAPVRTARTGMVLVVDDEQPVREFITAVLEESGFEVAVAEDGEAGVAAVRRLGVALDLVVLDLTMPTMGGDEALVEMRRVRADLPVLLSSGFSEKDARQRFGTLGVGGFLQKPYRAAALIEAVETILARRAPR